MKLKIDDFTFAYEDTCVLNNINLDFENDVTLVLGPNGSGKSTLMKCILGELKVPSNVISLDGVDVNKYKNWKRVGYVPQTIDVHGFPITVREFLSSFACKGTKEVIDVVKQTGIEHLLDKNISKLSGGETKRVYLARAVLHKIDLLILDEPLSAIDVVNKEIIIESLAGLKQSGVDLLIVTHNYDNFKSLATRVVVMDNQVAFNGSITEYDQYLGGKHGNN